MWWKKRKTEATARAVAYYRHSAEDRQENSIPIQREQVRRFADEHRIEIVREFADHGKSGLSTEGRDGFNEMLQLVRNPDAGFEYVLVLDVSRWGRFQDVDMSAYYRGYCKKHGKEVIYTSKGMPKRDDPMQSIGLVFNGYRAAEYSRELSDKVFKGCMKIAQQGFRAGGTPPYGLHRLLLDEQRRPVQILEPGQRKSIQNQRVTLAPGDEKEVAVVRRIFKAFVQHGQAPEHIAEELNGESVASPGGGRWGRTAVRDILTNELYIGTMVYNKTSQKLKSPSRRNSPSEWIRTPDAFPGIVDKKVFGKAREMLDAVEAARRQRFSPEGMLDELKAVLHDYGVVTPRLLAGREGAPSPTTYAKRFTSLGVAHQRLFPDVLQQAHQTVKDRLREMADEVEEYDDYLVLNGSFSVKIQPSVPVPWGYQEYWAFCPDPRVEVDVTLGVPLSNSGKYEILGFLLFPRVLVRSQSIRVFSSSAGQLELHGRTDLQMIDDLVS
jgi:DNA invertase Pin-like site-specific DNA recombinase